ncbi:MAG TPA: UPF0175 family protein [Bryobacteraceae bacterium]|nr:UPF0175 family protein [Bryobacteraceae bacterium]
MVITLDLPDGVAQALASRGNRDLSLQALQALAIEGYREDLLTQKQVGELLGLSRIQTEDFLAAHLDLYDYDPAELSAESAQLKRFSGQPR